MNRYHVYEDTEFIKTIEARSAKSAISKIEKRRGGYLINAQAVNAQDPADSYPIDWKPLSDKSNYP